MESGDETKESKGSSSATATDRESGEELPMGSGPETSEPPQPEADINDKAPVEEETEKSGENSGVELAAALQSWIGERLREHNVSYIQRLTKLETSVEQVKESVDRLPVKMRNLGREIKSITTSVSDSRLSDLLKKLLELSDLLNGLVENQPDPTGGADPVVHDTYVGLRTQMRQILQLSGVTEVAPHPGAPFDPTHHRATAKIPTSSAEQDKTICELQRIGFGSGEQILRYPEVTVYKYTPTSPTTPEANGEDSSTSPPA